MTLNYCDSLFREVRRCTSIAAIMYALEPIFERYKVIAVGLGRGGIYWRARKGGPWSSTGEMGPPPQGCAGLGRFNDPSGSLLYAALNQETALAEIRAQEGDQVQFAGYRTLLSETLRLAVVGEYMHLSKCGYMRFSGSDPANSMTRYVNGLGFDRAQEMLYIDAFLHSLLTAETADENGYIFTRAVAAMIHRDPLIDGIAYLSTKDPLGFNITVRPSAVASKLHIAACHHGLVERIREFGVIEFVKLREAIQLDGDIFQWAEPLPSPEIRFFNLTREEYEVGQKHRNNPNAFVELKRAHG